MPLVKKEEFNANLVEGKIKPFYIFFGSEFFIVNGCVDELIKAALCVDSLDFNFNEFDGNEFSFESLQNALSTVAVLSTYRIVLLKNLCYSKLSKTVDLKKFKQVVKLAAPTSVLVVTVFTEAFDYGQMKNFKAWLKNFDRVAEIVDCSASSNQELFKFFKSFVEKKKSSISQANFNFLVSRLSRNWHAVFSELEKLSAYAFNREISKTDIIKLTGINLNFTAFELANEILNFNTSKSLAILSSLIDADINLFLICGAINSCFIDLYRIFICVKRGLTDFEIANLFNYKGFEFKIRNSRKLCFKFNISHLRKCVSVLSNLDLKLKTTTVDKKILLEEAIVEMTSV